MANLEELEIYKQSLDIAEEIWSIIYRWNYFEKDTIGKQSIRAVDSIAANISEGFGRYHYQENKHFCYVSRGSLFETKTWLQKASDRKLMPDDVFQDLTKRLDHLHIKLNAYIKTIGKKSINNQ